MSQNSYGFWVNSTPPFNYQPPFDTPKSLLDIALKETKGYIILCAKVINPLDSKEIKAIDFAVRVVFPLDILLLSQSSKNALKIVVSGVGGARIQSGPDVTQKPITGENCCLWSSTIDRCKISFLKKANGSKDNGFACISVSQLDSYFIVFEEMPDMQQPDVQQHQSSSWFINFQ